MKKLFRRKSPDLFEAEADKRLDERYPVSPGHTGRESSIDGAKVAKSTAETDRNNAFAFIAAAALNGRTCEEAAQVFGKTNAVMAARLSELRNAGRICDSLTKRPAKSGLRVTVWINAALANEEQREKLDREIAEAKAKARAKRTRALITSDAAIEAALQAFDAEAARIFRAPPTDPVLVAKRRTMIATAVHAALEYASNA